MTFAYSTCAAHEQVRTALLDPVLEALHLRSAQDMPEEVEPVTPSAVERGVGCPAAYRALCGEV